MKVAQLHNGAEIHFPDGTPDEDMQAAVHNHLAFAKTMESTHGKEAMQRKQAMDRQHQETTSATMAHAKSMGALGEALKSGMESLLGPVSGLADASEAGLPALVKAIDNLASTVQHIGNRIIEAIYAPQDLVKDAKGAPMGVQKKRKG